MTDFGSRIQSYQDEIEDLLAQLVPPRQTEQAVLYEAMRYSLLGGGKRIRPVMLLAGADLLDPAGTNRATAKLLAAAVEMIHTYSLIHDDLPSMDNDTLRRGKPTSHVKYGEAAAILAGDALLNRAHELLLEAAVAGGPKAAEAGWVISRLAGGEGMIGGQIIDLASEGQDISLERLELLQHLKTGCMLRAPLLAAARLTGQKASVRDELDRYGSALGLAFQIRDDILDVISDSEAMGKTVGKDARDSKSTFVTLLGMAGAERRLGEEHRKALDACRRLASFGLDMFFFEELAEVLLTRTH